MLFRVARQRSAHQAAGIATTAGKQRDDVTQQYWNTVSTQKAAVTPHATGGGKYRVTCFLRVRQLRNKASCVARWYD
jgi:hypothetical protein